MSQLDFTTVESVYHHTVLPPKLPGKAESDLHNVETDLIRRLVKATSVIKRSLKDEIGNEYDTLQRCLNVSQFLNEDGRLNKSSLLEAFEDLELGDSLILHIREQNSGLIIQRTASNGNTVLFEAFEASPKAVDVLASENALQWRFPGSAVSINNSIFVHSSFQANLARFLEQASLEPIHWFAAHARKAGVDVVENRDTTDPSVITSMLMTLLEANGSQYSPITLMKRIRDDVCWDTSERPWRRSSFWLVLRVSLQRMLYSMFGNEVGHAHYKFLICVVLSHLLSDSLNFPSPELSDTIKAKLSRRLAKLEDNKLAVSAANRHMYEQLFTVLSPIFVETLSRANEHISAIWTSFKTSLTRCVPRLPQRAQNSDLQLQLLHSYPRIQKVLRVFQVESSSQRHLNQPSKFRDLDIAAITAGTYKNFADLHFSTARVEKQIEDIDALFPANSYDQEALFRHLMRILNHYMNHSYSLYKSFPEHMGSFLLNIFTLWMRVDMCATNLFPLLRDFRPGMKPELLDVLQLLRLQDMLRLQKLQTYVRHRNEHNKTSHLTIFSDPVEGCFAERYYDSPQNHKKLTNLKNSIEKASGRAKSLKLQEYQQKCNEYDTLTRKMSHSGCTMKRLETGGHDIRGCSYCYYVRSRKKIKISIHEDYLPDIENPVDSIQKKAIVFELAIPDIIKTYRDVTWKLYLSLTYPQDDQKSTPPEVLLSNYDPLLSHKRRDFNNPANFSLASFTKPFTATHYKEIRFPTELSQVNYPHALKYSYYDQGENIWAKDLQANQTLGHYFKLSAGTETPLLKFCSTPTFSPDNDGPSSNMIVASQNTCPSGHNVNEFIAFQSLFSGRKRRWLVLLLELGSSNLSFSSEDTMLLVNRLVREAGPARTDDYLRVVHQHFTDPYFCERLLDQVKRHLQGIASNWRESSYMNMLITLVLRSYELGDNLTRASSLAVLKDIREYTWTWLDLLREEIDNAKDSTAAHTVSKYALWASLLCRKTYSVYADQVEDLNEETVCTFIEASISMQENISEFPTTGPTSLKDMLISDIKMISRIHDLVHKSIESHPDCLSRTINKVWPQPLEGSIRNFSKWYALEDHSRGWIVAKVLASNNLVEQIVHFNYLYGYLLIDGKSIGKLPADFCASSILKEFFGDQNLQTLPSGMLGMSHMLAKPVGGHQVHLGLRDGRLIIRACIHNHVLELLERETFGTDNNLDLPEALIDGCAHWLNLQTGIVDIRSLPKVWQYNRYGNWAVDFNLREARRRTVILVDPHSRLFSRIASVFKHFEQSRRLTVYQPSSNELTVEIKHLDLSFSVLPNGLLFSRHLGSVIDPDQDAGTLYGLLSMIVLREKSGAQRRSIIIPQGPVIYKRHGAHVLSFVENQGSYSRYIIDDVLGRLYCPPEPRLLYTKALLHAITSFYVADNLTGRTGTEEALHCLRSGSSQPWTVLNPAILKILEQISCITPARKYYPRQIKRQQTVFWSTNLTECIQHDCFREIVEEIFSRVDRLSIFSTSKLDLPKLEDEHVSHLCRRSHWRRQQLKRCEPHFNSQKCPLDAEYNARDHSPQHDGSKNVFEIVSLLRFKPKSFPTTRNLARKLTGSPLIGGYDSVFDEGLSASLYGEIVPFWGSLVNSCLSDKKDTYDLMFQLSPLAYSNGADIGLIKTLIAFRLVDDLKYIEAPSYSSFVDFKPNEYPSIEHFRTMIRSCCQPFDSATQFPHEFSSRKKIDRARREHDQRCSNAVDKFTGLLFDQWPCEEPSTDGFNFPCIDVDEALNLLIPLWKRLYQNLGFSQYVERVQTVLNSNQEGLRYSKPSELDGQSQRVYKTFKQTLKVPMALSDMLNNVAPKSFVRVSQYDTKIIDSHSGGEMGEDNVQELPQKLEHHELQRIISGFISSDCPIRKQYGNDLQYSLDASRLTTEELSTEISNLSMRSLMSEICAVRKIICNHLRLLHSTLEQNDNRSQWLRQGHLWPCITQITLLEHLRSTAKTALRKDVKEIVVCLAILVTALQRCLRLKDALGKNRFSDFTREQKNRGHENWSPIKYPDWLLLEIESDLLLRKEQVDVARATIWPESKSNSVLQMNMGQGKTSCILPMVAAVLANGSQLCRIVVPKTLLPQTAQILQSRLGNLLDRKISHVPFSRSSPTDSNAIEAYRNIHQGALESCGILLTLPEHILSFKLSGLQILTEKRITEASEMIQIQNWISSTCRDVLDECDFTLATRTQLIYPSGTRIMVDGQADRWKCIQMLLDLVETHVWILQKKYPKSIQVKKRDGTEYSIISFLRLDVEDALLDLLLADVCHFRVPILIKDNLKGINDSTLRAFIRDENVSPKLADSVYENVREPRIRKIISLLRGLFAYRLLILCLKKRWNVQYGIHPDRDPVAVPFEAKGVPSEQNEWGQPDVSIIFTCLSFYYSGLSRNQLLQGLKHVLGSDDPATEYDRWIHSSSSLPLALRHWNVINLEDDVQISDIHRHLRYNLPVINHFLNKFVFPTYAKQFSVKLQASGWDVPLFREIDNRKSVDDTNKRARNTTNLTTGFSGTNDNKRMLPLTIKQGDLSGLSHTNAEVLTYLLQPRNRGYMVMSQYDGQQFSEYALLKVLHRQRIRVLIDAGAYILEMDNRTLVKSWLEVDHDAQAAIYFDSNNKAWVLDRRQKIIPLLASPFADRLGKCLVYLDQAHTRGTDLKLPYNAHGALTLGLGQTKDHTVQAAMRLRQLGSSQQVTFFAPPEVNQSILDFRQKDDFNLLDSSDVVCWLLEQTCNFNEQHLLLYLAQGLDFCRRTDAAWTNPDFLFKEGQRENYLKALQQSEHFSLEDLYFPKYEASLSVTKTIKSPQLHRFAEVLRESRPTVRAGDSTVGSALEQVEQEREIAHEVEQVREVEKPAKFKALPIRSPDPGVWQFAMSGSMPNPCHFDTALACMSKSALGIRYGLKEKTHISRLYVSSEYPRTIATASNRPNDNFMRPVNWLLWSPHKEIALIIIPEEAEMLIPTLRAIKKPMTHLLTYAAPVTKTMLHFNSLNYYSLPSLPQNWKPPLWLVVELGLFSGRLYFSFDEYSTVLNHLGQDFDDEIKRTKTYSVTNVQKVSSQGQEISKYFSDEPLNFFQDWLTVRRKGQDISYTPMGYVCEGRLLTREHPFFASTEMFGLTKGIDDNIAEKMTRMEVKDLGYKRAQTMDAKVVDAHRDVEDGNEAALDSDDSWDENDDDFNYDDAEIAGDGDFDERGDQSSEDESSESSI